MPEKRRINLVHRSLSRPLTILGAERKLFFFSLCLGAATFNQLTKRLESALKLFDENYRVYQYLFKRNNETIPYTLHANPVVSTAILNRIAYLQSRAENLFSLSIYFVVLCETNSPTDRVTNTVGDLADAPTATLKRLLTRFSSKKQIA